jgi:AcrR family transcriptional regulator
MSGSVMDERFRDRMRRERIDVILREAATLATERGWSSLRLEDVARRAGIAKGTIYLDFKDKDELVSAAIRRSMTELRELMESAVGAAEADEELEAALRILATLPVERPDLAALLRCTQTEWSVPPGALDGVERLLTRLVKKAQSRGRVGADVDAEFAAQATLAAASVPAWSRIATKHGADSLLAQLPFRTN